MIRTLTQLEEILVKERKIDPSCLRGAFGLESCKESIRWQMENFNKTLEQVYFELIERGLTDIFFNTYMIVACEQMLKENKQN